MTDLRKQLINALGGDFLANLTADLIRIPSYFNLPNQETALAEYIHDLLKKEGIKTWTVDVQDGRHNVYGLLKGSGNGKTLMLNGHLDTVPPYDMENALVPILRDGKLFGRGAADMKGPIAAMLGAMIALKRLGIKPASDILFAGVIDEELQSLGTIHLIENGPQADAAIVGEPSDGNICIAHRGLEWYEFVFKGKTVHGGRQDEGVSAISKAAWFVRMIEKYLVPKLKARTHPLLEHATINIGVINGGTQLSTVAGECLLQLDRRFLPDERYEDVGKELQNLLYQMASEDPDFRCEMQILKESVMKAGYVHMPLEIDDRDPFVELVKSQLESARGGAARLSYFPAWTDGGLLSYYGRIPTVVYGPGKIECCHSSGEFIEIDQLIEGCLTYALCAVAFCA